MEIFLAIIIGLVTILFLITMHEFAHFVIAKLAGAYVYEFAIGMGPKILQWGKKETRYTLRLLPLGGYVAIASEIVDPPKGRGEEVVENKRLMENLHRGKKAAFISAGAIMNLLLAFALLIVGYSIYPHKYDPTLPPTFASKGPLASAVDDYNKVGTNIRILPDSVITHIWNKDKAVSNCDINSFNDLKKWLKLFNIKNNAGQISEYEVTFDKDKKQIITMKSDEKTLFVGVSQSSYALKTGAAIVSNGIIDTFKNSYSLLHALGQLITFHWEDLSGPIGIVKSTNSFLNPELTSVQATSIYFRWAALLSTNLFLLNLLPIPPLDGYKFVENAIESITRKKLSQKYKIFVTIAGAILFLGIFIVITIKDIIFF